MFCATERDSKIETPFCIKENRRRDRKVRRGKGRAGKGRTGKGRTGKGISCRIILIRMSKRELEAEFS